MSCMRMTCSLSPSFRGGRAAKSRPREYREIIRPHTSLVLNRRSEAEKLSATHRARID